jgi:hypothetical protein
MPQWILLLIDELSLIMIKVSMLAHHQPKILGLTALPRSSNLEELSIYLKALLPHSFPPPDC